ncbi:hypothetical protein GV827_13975 [Sulfitobacter sp. JBTF-M27]|uniref:Uncharacterized protein n=1 Tax=Sulfitobacter sediminilitoris TaxID=2698830 RepID=A0A6P0CDT6_9RHOB|nr:hypothetical protein [Sulfitobacter sediminilitoris]NEK23510.1 hypothetical protein [Sulfitobacter sediminilitoris]
MRLRYIALIAAIVSASTTSLAAQTFKAENRVIVTPQSNGLFSVSAGNYWGARGAWCAAADYAMDVLGASGTTRLYVQVPTTTPSGPVTFGLTPGNTTPVGVVSVSASLRTAGSNLSIDHAFQFCYDARLQSIP